MKNIVVIALSLGLIGSLVGCGVSPTTANEPIEVAGSVTGPDGKPMKDVTIRFTPASAGTLPNATAADAQGKFKVKLIPGNYIYSLESKSPAALKSVPANYLENDASHTVEVKAGQDLSIQVK